MDKALDEASNRSGKGFRTGHHKLAKSAMETLYGWLTPTQWGTLVRDLDLEPSSGVNALKSLGSNLAFGPQSGDRDRDPGREFDPNRTRQGSLTPRSSLFNELLRFIEMRREFGSGETLSAQEFKRVREILNRAEQIHFAKTGGELVDEDDTMWQSSTEGWKRGSAGDYQVNPSAYESSVRDLKKPEHRASQPKKRESGHEHRFLLMRFRVDHFSTPLDRESLERWKSKRYLVAYNRELKERWFIARESLFELAKKGRLSQLTFIHTEDTPENEVQRYGIQLLRPFSSSKGKSDLMERPSLNDGPGSGPETRPLPNPWAQQQPQAPPTLDQAITHIGFDRERLHDFLLLTPEPERRQLRSSYQEDLDLVLGYSGRVDEGLQRLVLSVLDDLEAELARGRCIPKNRSFGGDSPDAF